MYTVAGRIAAIVLPALLGLSALAGPVEADRAPVSKFIHKPDAAPCVTDPEYQNMPGEGATPQDVAEFVDTKGWSAMREGLYRIQHYAFCDHPYGWLSVSYELSKRGWRYSSSVLIRWCKHSDGDGPMVPCDNTVPHYLEEIVLSQRGARSDSSLVING